MFEEKERQPEVLSATNIALAVAAHLLFFALCWVLAHPLREKAVVIPIDMTVVVHENLDGDENEPPPLEPPKPPPPAPKPPPPKPDPSPPPAPKPPEKAPDAVVKTPEKKAEKPKPKEPEKPKKTKEQSLKERQEEMRNRVKVVNAPAPKTQPKPQPNGRTGKKTLSDAEIQKLLKEGIPPGTTEQLATSEEQRCISLIYKAYYDKWDSPPYSPAQREMLLRVTFDAGGRVVNWTLTQGSGDAAVDASVRRAAQRVSLVSGLSYEFLRKNKTVTVRFKVKPQ